MSKKKLTIEEMRVIAAERSGKCLSDSYTHSRTKLKWQCKKGHIWEARPNNVKRGSWCPKCAGSERLTIEEAQTMASKRGGKCLSSSYINNREKLKWRCREGHIWTATLSAVKYSETWCPKCSGKARPKIEESQALARERGGKCLSDTYVNSRTKLKWQCGKGHVWEATLQGIRYRSYWCPKCAGVGKLDLSEMQKIAIRRGGRCLSNTYVNSKTKLKWRCVDGHIWAMQPNAVKNGQWCPVCSTFISERVCRKLFEHIFAAEFPKSRPRWLVNAQGNQMELDGYSRELGIAFEYQGRQHYFETPLYHKGTSFKRRKKSDTRKRELCKKHRVILIEIPYTVKLENVLGYTVAKCRKVGIVVPPYKKIAVGDLGAYTPGRLDVLKALATNRGGECLSSVYIRSDLKMDWRCRERHIWRMTSNSVKQGQWCPKCAGRQKLTIEEMRTIAKSRGGECLSEKYINKETKLRWKCERGHIWEATPSTVKHSGSWCPKCSGKAKLTIEDMQAIASKRGGKCLSGTYVNNRTKLKWQCERGHTWEATFNNIRKGNWCPKC